MLRAAVILLFAACATLKLPEDSGEKYPNQECAVEIVWRSYGRTDTPPRVILVKPDCVMPAPDGRPGFMGPVILGGRIIRRCLRGDTPDFWRCYIAHEPGKWPQDESLAHELRHAAGMRSGIFDPDHKRREWWGPSGDVERANALLQSENVR